MRRLLSLLTLAVVSTSVTAAPVPAGTGGAIPAEAPVPAKAMLVAHVQGVDRVKGKVESFLNAAFAKDGDRFVGQFRDWLADGLDGKELKGLSKDGRCYFVVHDFENFGENPFSFVVPVDDAVAFVAGVFPAGKVESREKLPNGIEKVVANGEDHFVVTLPGRVVVAGTEEIATEYAKSLTTLKSAQLGDDAAKAFFQSDVSVFVNLPAINEAHAEHIKQFRGILSLLLNQAGGAAGMEKRQIELVKVAYDGIFQMIEDGRAVVLAAEVTTAGIGVKLVGRFASESPTGRVLAAERPSKLTPLDLLPAGFTNYSASAFGPRAAAIAQTFYREFAAGDGEGAATEKLKGWADLLVRATVSVSAADYGTVGVAVTTVPDAAGTVAAMLGAVKSLKAGASFQNVKLKSAPAVMENAETVGGRNFHRVTLSVDYVETAKHLPEPMRAAAVASMKKLLPETTNVWVAADGGRMIQVTAPKWEDAKAALERLDAKAATVGSDAATKSTRAALPAEASYVGLYDVVRGLNFLRDYLPALTTDVPGTEVAGEVPKLNPVSGPAAYAGLAVTLKGELAVVDLFVPVAAAGPIRQAIHPFLNK